jgi:hypothetical protein
VPPLPDLDLFLRVSWSRPAPLSTTAGFSVSRPGADDGKVSLYLKPHLTATNNFSFRFARHPTEIRKDAELLTAIDSLQLDAALRRFRSSARPSRAIMLDRDLRLITSCIQTCSNARLDRRRPGCTHLDCFRVVSSLVSQKQWLGTWHRVSRHWSATRTHNFFGMVGLDHGYPARGTLELLHV